MNAPARATFRARKRYNKFRSRIHFAHHKPILAQILNFFGQISWSLYLICAEAQLWLSRFFGSSKSIWCASFNMPGILWAKGLLARAAAKPALSAAAAFVPGNQWSP